jgi:hypothetical protein
MKVCLYLEGNRALGGRLYHGIDTGLTSSYRNQRRVLDSLGIRWAPTWHPSCDLLQLNVPWPRSVALMPPGAAAGKEAGSVPDAALSSLDACSLPTPSART